MGLEGVGPVADAGESLEDLAQGEQGRIPLDTGPVGGGVDHYVAQTGQGGEVAFDEPGAGGAGEPLHAELDLPQGAGVGDELLLHIGQIIVGEGGQLGGDHLPLGARGGAVFVVAGEAALHDGLGDRLAAWAAHWPEYPFDLKRILTVGRHRLATVKTAGHGMSLLGGEPVNGA